MYLAGPLMFIVTPYLHSHCWTELSVGYTFDIQDDIDVMDGHDFEHYVSQLLENEGFTNITVTKKSNDWGADVLAERHKAKYAIQVKRWTKLIDDRAVYEVSL